MFLEVLFLKRQENLELKGLDLRKSENTQSPRLFANAVKLDQELLQKKKLPRSHLGRGGRWNTKHVE